MADKNDKSKRDLSRKPERFDVDMNTKFRLRGEKDWHEGHVVNLSEGGFCLQTETELKSEQILEFLFDTVDVARRKHRRVVLARVVWKRLTRYGIQFVRSVGKNSPLK